MSKNIESIEGVGNKTGKALRKTGVRTVENLVDAGRTKAGRNSLSATIGIDKTQLMHCVNMANLFHVSGVASQLAGLLVVAGGNSVKGLRDRSANNVEQSTKPGTAIMDEAPGIGGRGPRMVRLLLRGPPLSFSGAAHVFLIEEPDTSAF